MSWDMDEGEFMEWVATAKGRARVWAAYQYACRERDREKALLACAADIAGEEGIAFAEDARYRAILGQPVNPGPKTDATPDDSA